MNVEKGPSTDLAQNANTWGGIPEQFGCSNRMYTSYASINIAGTTRTEVIWGETCSVSNDEGGTISGMAIAFIEQGHYVTVFIVGATTSATLSSDTTLSGILSGIDFVTTKPADANAEESGGSGGGSGGGSSDTPFTGTASAGQYLCAADSNEIGIKDSCGSSEITVVRFNSWGNISLPVDSSGNAIWSVSGCNEFSTNDIQGDTITIGYGKITNPCRFELKSDTTANGYIYFTLNTDGTYLVELSSTNPN